MSFSFLESKLFTLQSGGRRDLRERTTSNFEWGHLRKEEREVGKLYLFADFGTRPYCARRDDLCKKLLWRHEIRQPRALKAPCCFCLATRKSYLFPRVENPPKRRPATIPYKNPFKSLHVLQERDCANRRYKEGASPRLKSATLRSLMSQQTRKTLGGGDREARKTKFLLLQEMQDRKDREAPSGKSSTFLFYLCFYLLLLLALPTQLHLQDFSLARPAACSVPQVHFSSAFHSSSPPLFGVGKRTR